MSNSEHESTHTTYVKDCPTCEMGPTVCPECGGPADERVVSGMKCARCAYGAPTVRPEMR